MKAELERTQKLIHFKNDAYGEIEGKINKMF